MPRAGVEFQASRAFVRSPGIIQGGAFDHTQTSASVRLAQGALASMPDETVDHAAGHGMDNHAMPALRRYLLIEVARTDEGFGAQRAFRYHSLLVEGLLRYRGWQTALRLERTERPENERLLDPFRIANGHIDFQIIGITRWQVGTAHLATPPVRARHLRGVQFTPYIEIGAARPTAVRRPAVFEPDLFYGGSTLWSLTVGVRMHLGQMRARMGRYGVLDTGPRQTP